ncbi:MAG: helical backbone metal receptor [Nitrososphaerota archaeon]|nr:helical backbone metal receptor [Nitrososphaerota archaeon]
MEKTKITVAIILIAIITLSVFFVIFSTQNFQFRDGITITDSQGYPTTLSAAPERIISIAPSITPILFEIGVGDKVVGVTDYDNSPYDFSAWFVAGNMTSIGGYSNPNIETILSLQPDIIFTTDINDITIPNMRNIGLNVIVVGPNSIDEIFQTIKIVGKATGAEKNADTLVNNLSTQINNVISTINNADITKKPTVYYEIWYSTAGFMTLGANTWVNDVITTAGGTNIFNDINEPYPTTNSEVIITKNPDVMLFPTAMGDVASYGSLNEIKNRSGWNTINAVKNNRIYIIDENLFSQPGIRVAELVQTIAKCLYPDLFP